MKSAVLVRDVHHDSGYFSCTDVPYLPLSMSRRKQSNPKPLKREDDEEGSEDTGKMEPANSPSPPSEPSGAPRTPSPHAPRVRLNAALATDPGAPGSPPTTSPASPPAAVTPCAHPAGLEYLAALQPAFQHALATAGRLFPPLPVPTLPDGDVNVSLNALAKPTPVRPKSEQPPGIDPRTVACYMCAPCGIRFSSVSTLEAHQTYYCTHRIQPKRESDVDEPKSPLGEEGPTPVKSSRVGKQYGCPHCSYSADKKVSLNRHMRMHASSPATPNGAAPPAAADAVALDRYCHDCDIRFSSVKTLKAHKMHYCGSRHGHAGPGHGKTSPVSTGTGKTGSAPASPTSPPRVSPDSQQFLVLPTDPVLIVPYSLVQSASVITGATLPRRDTACVVLRDGTVQSMSDLVSSSGEAVLRLRGERNAAASSPLDLTMPRSPDQRLVIDEDEKENVFSSSPHEDIVCAPSIPALLAMDKRSPGRKSETYSTSPSPPSPLRKSPWKSPNGLCKAEADRVEVKREVAPSPEHLHGAVLPLVTDLPLRGVLPPDLPQVLVKQGVSKCQECNIVFLKHENYVAHKKHYCSSRSGDSAEESSRTSPGSKSPGSAKDSSESRSPGPGKAATLYQFICVACGIKFTALDNLTAHQAYYCPKRSSESAKVTDEKPRKCAKCKSLVSGDHQCAAAVPGWKCPCCEVVSPTAASAQKHMEVHTGVRAFRCTICRYKGNTLRGMRTHIRMHFDKKNLDLQEENFITCIVDDEPVVNGEAAAPQPTLPALASLPTAATLSVMTPVVVKQEAVEDELVDVGTDAVPLVPALSPKTPDSATAGENGRRASINYCQTCDISFNYPASYRAHKQFYCSTNVRTRSPRTVTPETSVQ